MRGRLPSLPIPGQTVGGGVPDAPRNLPPTPIPRVATRGDSRCHQHPRRGQDPSLQAEPLTGVRVTPRAGHARPLPRGGPETGVRVNPAGVSISPSVGRGAPTPPRPSVTARSRANRRGRRPRRPAKPPANGHPPGSHPRRGQDPSLRTELLTPAYANPRAGHARPLPHGGPGTGVRVNPAGVSISPSVGRGAPTPPRPSAAANTPGGITTLAFPLGGRWPRRAG